MGIDLMSIAVPLDAEPVRAIRAGPSLWAQASDQPPFCSPWGDEPLPEISQNLLAVMPAGTGWVDHFDRCFFQAEYLLDPAAFRTPDRTAWQRKQGLAYRIVLGAEVFAEHAQSGQGFTWRCSTAQFLATAAQRIDELDVTAARRAFSVAEMDQMAVYKVHPEEDDDDAFDRLLARLRTYAQHCRRVAADGLGLIVTLY